MADKITDMDTTTLTIQQARTALDNGDYTAVQLTQAYLDAIAAQNDTLHAYLEVFTEDALADAARADEMIAAGKAQALTGIPIAIKDNILYEGHIASAASKILSNYRASYTATAVEKLRAQGAVILGRTNMDEFALGSSTENSAYGRTMNPHDHSRVPGGTSGGSAAAVAAGLALAALGSDTGGSIRQPAGFCGVVGLKPTYGAVSRYGVMAAISSTDQIGPIARTAADTEALFNAIRGVDARDSTTREFTEVNTHKVIGVPRAFISEGVDEDVLTAFNTTLETLTMHGYEVRNIDMPYLADALPVYYIINFAEVSSNLERIDGLRYGVQAEGDSYKEIFSKSRGEGFGKETRRRIMLGAYVLSAGYADEYYRQAVAAREHITQEITKTLQEVDIVAMPTSPAPAFKAGEHADPLAMYAADIFTVPVSITGVPGLSVPCGTAKRDGNELPVGIQLISKHGGESALFTVANTIEKAAK